MTEFNVTYALQDARVKVGMAKAACPHWNYAKLRNGGNAPCCRAVRESRRRYQKAKRAYIEAAKT